MNRLRPERQRLVGVAAGLAACGATATLVMARNGSSNQALAMAPVAGVGQLRPALATGPRGPEGVPIPAGPPLARPRLLRDGEPIDGITCQVGERAAFHIHMHLRIVVRGLSREVPAGIGVAPPYEVALTPTGRFVAGASCFMWLHTHAADGIVHVESPVQRTYFLGDLFDVWGQPLNRRQVGPARGPVTAFLNGGVFTGNPRRIPVLPHGQVELEVGRPLFAPERVLFPRGL